MPSDPQRSDRSLVHRCLAGEPEAGEALVLKYQPLLAGVVRRTLRRFGAAENPETVRDLLQDLWVSLLEGDSAPLRRYDGERPLEPLLAVAAVSRTIDHLRRRQAPLSLDSPAGTQALLDQVLPPVRPGAAEESRLGEQGDRLHLALSRLAPQEQAVLRLFYWEEMPAEGIAGMLKLQPGSVRSLLTRCREKLRTILAGSAFLIFF